MDNECAICLDTIDIKDLEILKCTHKFHKECINSWIQKSPTCPYCREFLKPFFESKQRMLYFFYRKCNIFIDTKNISNKKVVIVFNYPFTNKVQKTIEIDVNKIKSISINKDTVFWIHKLDKKESTVYFRLKKNEAQILHDAITNIFHQNYNIYTNSLYSVA